MITLNLLALAIGIGLLLTLLGTEAVGIAAGGLEHPGILQNHSERLSEIVFTAVTIV